MIWRYYAYKFFISLHFFSAVLVPFFMDWGGLTQFQIQLVQSWFMLWLFLLEVPTGAIADYIGRKHSLALGALSVAIAALVYGSYPHIYVFLLAEFLFALAAALSSGADEALLYDTLKEAGREEESKKIMGKAHAINLFGLLVSAPIGGLLAARLGLNAPILFAALPFLIAMGIAWTIKEPLVRTVSETKRYLEIVRSGLAYLWHHRTLKILTLDMVGVSVAAYFIIWFYQPLLTEVGVPVVYFGIIHAAFVGAEILVSANFPLFEKIVGSPNRYLRLTALVTAILFMVVAIFPSPTTIILFAVVAGAVGLSRIEYIGICLQPFIPSDKRATVLSAVSMMRKFALFAANPIIGYLATISLGGTLLILSVFPLAIGLFSPARKLSVLSNPK